MVEANRLMELYKAMIYIKNYKGKNNQLMNKGTNITDGEQYYEGEKVSMF